MKDNIQTPPRKHESEKEHAGAGRASGGIKEPKALTEEALPAWACGLRSSAIALTAAKKAKKPKSQKAKKPKTKPSSGIPDCKK